MPSYTEIIPESYQVLLINISHQTTDLSWELGDITREIIVQLVDTHPEIDRAFIYSAIGAFAGRSARTIREYHHLAREFEIQDRERYSILSFDHFRTAATFGDLRYQALEWAVFEADNNGGRPATVDAMYAHFMDTLQGAGEEQGEDQDENTSDDAILRKYIPQMAAILRKLLDTLGQDNEYRQELKSILDTLEYTLQAKARPA